MTNKKNIIIYAFIIVCSFFSFSKGIEAEEMKASSDPIPDSCIDDETCIPVCSYKNQIKGYQRQITIYYYFDQKEFKISFHKNKKKPKITTKGPKAFDKLFSKSGYPNVYVDKNINLSADEFTCPKKAFINYDWRDELCFDNSEDGSLGYCENEYNKFGTEEHGEDFNQSHDYDYENKIIEIGESMPEYIDNAIKTNETNLNEIDNTTIVNLGSGIISKDILHENEMPTFVGNSPAMEDFPKIVADGAETWKGDTVEEINNNTLLTEEEKINQLDNIENIDTNKIEMTLAQKIQSEINEYSFINSDSLSCEAVFGDQDDANYPAYWIQWSLNLMKYIAIIALLVLSTMDFLKAMVNQDKDAIQKAAITTAKRFVFAVLIFFLPIIVEFIMNLFGAYGTCGLG